jgi:hypothetical protein
MRTLLSIFAAIIPLLVSSAAMAESVGTGTITSIYAHSSQFGGPMYSIVVSEPISNKASCNITNRFTTKDKELISLILSAKLAGKRVDIHGSGECSQWPDAETILYIHMP